MKRNQIKIESITIKDIKELSEKKVANGLSFSLYLGIKPAKNFVSEANSAISETVKKILKEGSYSKSETKEIERISLEIKKRIRLFKLPDETRSIVIFRDTKRFIRIFRIPVYIPSKFVIEADFFVHPLIEALEQNPKYIVIVLERDKARFFRIFFGEMEEMPESITSDVPQKMNEARVDWKGLSEGRIRGHIEDHKHRHLKKACKVVEDYFKFEKNGLSYLIIGAHRELIRKFSEMLGERSKKKLVGSYHIMPNYRLNRIKEKSQKIIMEYEREAEKRLTDKMFDDSSKKKSFAVFGAGPVMDNFYQHNVNVIVIGQKFNEKGFVCPDCHYVSSYMKICPKDKKKMIEVIDLADEIIEDQASDLRKQRIR
jgi:peptide chain release factor subunit 1